MTEMLPAFYLCLLSSLIWAPLVFIAALALNKKTGGAYETWLWPSALAATALPVLAAPGVAALGFSLRSATVRPPMMLAPPDNEATRLEAAPMVASGSGIDIATLLNAAGSLYFYGFILFLALGLIRMAAFAYRVRSGFPIDDHRLIAGLERWRATIGVHPGIRFVYCDAVSSVCVHGFLHPVILMPPDMLQRVSTGDAILMGAHELAHVKRRDTLLFALCSLARAIFWFNPFARRIIAQTQLAAEQGADALVIARGADKQSYARCFIHSLKVSSGLSSPQHTLVPSFTPFDRASRKQRLDAILAGPKDRRLSAGARAGLIGSVSLASFLAIAQAALAVSPQSQGALAHSIVDGGRLTSGFGVTLESPDGKPPQHHNGVDIAAPLGAPVYSAGDGKIIAVTSRYQDNPGWGNVIVIDHGHGLITRFAHLGAFTVQQGDRVKAGEKISVIGLTGKTTGPHVHFEVIYEGEIIDPLVAVAPWSKTVGNKARTTPSRTIKLVAPAAPAPAASPRPAPAPAAPGATVLTGNPKKTLFEKRAEDLAKTHRKIARQREQAYETARLAELRAEAMRTGEREAASLIAVEKERARIIAEKLERPVNRERTHVAVETLDLRIQELIRQEAERAAQRAEIDRLRAALAAQMRKQN